MQVPIPTQKAPDFDVPVLMPDFTFSNRKLSDYQGSYLCIIFYPMDFTYVCPSEIIEFNQKVSEFRKHHCELLIGSCDSEFSHYQWALQKRSEGGIEGTNIPIFSDKTHKFSKDYGCYLEDAGVSLRAMYIISDKGIIRHVTLNDLPVGRSVQEALRLVQAFQYADKTGDVIPCGWKPENEDDVIKGNTKEYKHYFKNHYK